MQNFFGIGRTGRVFSVEGPTLRRLPRAAQQLKLLPRVERNLIFCNLEPTRSPILMALERTNEKKRDL